MLKINSLNKSFGKKTVLDSLNLEITEGSIFGLVGVNGAGKSTLLRCIAGIYEADAGNVLFNEEDTYRNEEIRKDILSTMKGVIKHQIPKAIVSAVLFIGAAILAVRFIRRRK